MDYKSSPVPQPIVAGVKFLKNNLTEGVGSSRTLQYRVIAFSKDSLVLHMSCEMIPLTQITTRGAESTLLKAPRENTRVDIAAAQYHADGSSGRSLGAT
jgi:hypothetical protein